MARPGSFLGMKFERADMNARKLWVLLGLLALCLGAALPLFAQADAAASPKGAFPEAWGALKGSDGLEVRDELNRPVSRARVEGEVRAGALAMLRQGASFAKAGALRALLDTLERADLLRDVLRSSRARARGENFAALLAREVRAAAPGFLASVPVPSCARLISSRSLSPASRIPPPTPLRC